MSGMTARTGIRVAVVTGAAVLCAGAAPALAHGSDGATTARYDSHTQELSFAQQQQLALARLGAEARWLSGLKDKVAADDRLTAQQKSDFTAKLDRALAQVAQARAAAQAATTPGELKDALDSAELPYMDYPEHTLPSLADTKAAAERFLAHRAQRLSDLRARVAADDRLTAGQKSAFLGKIDAALAAVAKAKDAVAAATSRADVRAALAPVSWVGRYPKHHLRHRIEPTDAKLVSARVASARHTVTVHRMARKGDWRHRCGQWGNWGERTGSSEHSGTWDRHDSGWTDGHDGGWGGDHHDGGGDGWG